MTLSGYIFASKVLIDNRKKLLSSNISSRCPHNMVNFGPLAAEIGPVVWAPQLISTGFASWQRYCTALKTAALNRERHLYSAGRPSRWALAHILVCFDLDVLGFKSFSSAYCCTCLISASHQAVFDGGPENRSFDDILWPIVRAFVCVGNLWRRRVKKEL